MAEAVADEQEIKQRAVRRLIVAVVLVLAAVGLLTYLSYYKPAKIVTKPIPENLPPPPPPIVSGPEPTPLTPAEPPAALPEPPPPAITAPDNAALPPPPKVVAKPLAAPGPGPKKSSANEIEKREAQQPLVPKPLVRAEAPKPTPAPAAPVPATATPAPAPAETTAAKAAPAYVVQFGVFSNTQNALQLVEKLKQIGIAARTETRVQLPAFKSKAEAEAALAKLKEKGIPATLVAH